MISRARMRPHAIIVVLLLLTLSLFLVACERPLRDDPAPDEATATPDAEQGGGTISSPTQPPPVVDEQPTEAAPAQEEDGGIPSEDPDDAVDVEETAEDAAEEVAEEVEEATEEVTEAAGEAVDEVTEEAGEGEAQETDPSELGGTEGDSEVGGGVDESAADTDTAAPAAGDSEVGGGVGEPAEEAAASGEVGGGRLGTEQVHIVQAGENLYRIGLRYGVSWVVLADYNNLPNANSIYVGQQLLIPGDPEEGGGTPDDPVTYVVQPGDNLYRIGQRFNVNWREIAAANNLANPYRIYVGQVLTIPTDASPPPPAVTHIVRRGETLFSISLHYNVPWTIIADANEIDPPYIIYPGESLTIPAE